MAALRTNLLLLAVVALAATGVAEDATIQADEIFSLINKIDQRQSAPTVDDVVAAYREYVALHKQQSALSGLFDNESATGQPQGKTEAERQYKRVSDILTMPKLVVISNNLFSAVSDDLPADFASLRVDADDRRRIASAIEALAL